MDKQEFLTALQKGLEGLTPEDIRERIIFYSEMIDDRIEEGLTEEMAVAELGSVEDIIIQTMSEFPWTKLVKKKFKQKRTLQTWEIICFTLGSPIWLSLSIAILAIIISIYAIIWSVIISLWAIEFSVIGCSFAGLFSCIIFITQSNTFSGMAMLGAGFMCAGLSIFGFLGCQQISKLILTLTRKIFVGIKSSFMKRRQ